MNHKRIRAVIRTIGIMIFVAYMFIKLRELFINGGSKTITDPNGDNDVSADEPYDQEPPVLYPSGDSVPDDDEDED